MVQVTVRGVDEQVFRDFKAEAIREGLRLGKALNIVMERWVEEESKKKISFLNLKPFDWGKGTEKTSQEIDKILYGE